MTLFIWHHYNYRAQRRSGSSLFLFSLSLPLSLSPFHSLSLSLPISLDAAIQLTVWFTVAYHAYISPAKTCLHQAEHSDKHKHTQMDNNSADIYL